MPDWSTGGLHGPTYTPNYKLQITKDGTALSVTEVVRQVVDGEDPDAFKGVLVEAVSATFPQAEDDFSLNEPERPL